MDARRKTADVRSQGLLAERKTASSNRTDCRGKSETTRRLGSIASYPVWEMVRGGYCRGGSRSIEIETLLLETPNLPDERVPHGVSRTIILRC